MGHAVGNAYMRLLRETLRPLRDFSLIVINDIMLANRDVAFLLRLNIHMCVDVHTAMREKCVDAGVETRE